jgi:hypothetical protein
LFGKIAKKPGKRFRGFGSRQKKKMKNKNVIFGVTWGV